MSRKTLRVIGVTRRRDRERELKRIPSRVPVDGCVRSYAHVYILRSSKKANHDCA